jgi:hypothetical protein
MATDFLSQGLMWLKRWPGGSSQYLHIHGLNELARQVHRTCTLLPPSTNIVPSRFDDLNRLDNIQRGTVSCYRHCQHINTRGLIQAPIQLREVRMTIRRRASQHRSWCGVLRPVCTSDGVSSVRIKPRGHLGCWRECRMAEDRAYGLKTPPQATPSQKILDAGRGRSLCPSP